MKRKTSFLSQYSRKLACSAMEAANSCKRQVEEAIREEVREPRVKESMLGLLFRPEKWAKHKGKENMHSTLLIIFLMLG